MMRIAGSVLLLAGLSGCMSPSGNSVQVDKRGAEAKSSMPAPSVYGFSPTPNVPMNTVWTPHPEHRIVARQDVDSMAARMQPAGGVVAPIPTPLAQVPAPVPAPAAPVVLPPITQPPAPLPASLVPMVTTPPSASAAIVPASAPTVVAPLPEVAKEQTIIPAIATQVVDPVTTAAKVDAAAPTVPAPMPELTPPMPKKAPADSKTVKVGTPLMRLVNTKRITLNFEVKDIGPSGLANVELWYTQNCRDWKKYDAPTNSKAYVVEVDEEGMYGFTLVARSGVGLSKEAPQPGDQPQVWTIVDLTAPDLKLIEATPAIDGKQQQVTFVWKASDKNFSRSPISLSYAEKEAGPWHVIAANLENTGKYVWQMPAGTPPKIIVRVEATDLAGNVSRAQSDKPLLLDNKTPSVSITNVEANSEK